MRRPSLYSCSIRCQVHSGDLIAFFAMIADDEEAVRRKLTARFGVKAASAARVIAGFDIGDRVAMQLVSERLADTLALFAAEPESPLATGFEITLEQRFILL